MSMGLRSAAKCPSQTARTNPAAAPTHTHFYFFLPSCSDSCLAHSVIWQRHWTCALRVSHNSIKRKVNFMLNMLDYFRVCWASAILFSYSKLGLEKSRFLGQKSRLKSRKFDRKVDKTLTWVEKVDDFLPLSDN